MISKDYMRLAIHEAKKSTQPIRCGCVIVKGDQLLAAAYNSQHDDSDPTAHAEIKAIREAGKQHGRGSLKNATVYCTCEPCVMCLAALSIAGISKLFYAVPLKKVFEKDNIIPISPQTFNRATPWKFDTIKTIHRNMCFKALYEESSD
ncbi:hypothetical protein A2W24_01675 [Microgenomates group bacterium RBG_16_45_19]|nr:MAG: hypothetical protein A2W24_01675 [Microgenomates group bacterium RBG_16_45_19]